MRADAARNRARILAAADAVFTVKGTSASTEDVAERAGVGIGTVFRHFPAKQELISAVLDERIARLARQARALGNADDPGAAFLTFFTGLIEHALENKALVDALGGTAPAASNAKQDLLRAGGALLARAQAAGAIRADLDADDLQALVTGCLEMERRARESGRPGRMLALMRDAIGPR
jgi:AcrR family transcriptional regulator